MEAKSALEIVAALSEPFPPEEIQWRVGRTTQTDKGLRGLALAYIDARTVMRQLDAHVGPENWRDRYEIKQVIQSRFDKQGKHVTDASFAIVICTLAVRIGGEWIEKSDAADMTDIEAAKGGVSDALKRAAVKWGIGRYLYELESPWVNVNQYKQIDEKEYPRLRKLLPVPKGQKAAEPEKVAKGKVDRADRDAISAANLRVLADFGYTEQQIHDMLPAERYRPARFALDQLGLATLNDLDKTQLPKLYELMEAWAKLEEPIEKTKAGDAADQ